ncbi:acyltransferase [Paraglaciecola aquimarina]|uniref:Acyltransferase n=1 Tax=Paraglaciecola algarum TaxID=3050085 RepID=A0ABS9D326_9ALTE|nr:acyltransferase [Paraglaciecola sp. G1-23]MCF2947315.1 acyltransferase [Paraglaciecola sp. G1-23]
MFAVFSVIFGAISTLIYFLNTILWLIPILVFSFLKLLPIPIWQTFMSYLLDGCATMWISVNTLNQNLFSRTKIEITGLEGVSTKDWYLVISNHRSWVDILVLQRVFNRKIPFLKFFLKKELIWVPFLGLAWWALDFPFMHRYSKALLAKRPDLKGKDLENTRKACEKFKHKPVSIMNFVEGTRLTDEKHKRQSGQFQHLLKPKAGGIAFVLGAMGEQLHKLLDVTIHYPDGTPSYWDFVSGKVRRVQVQVKVQSVDELLKSDAFGSDYFENPTQRVKFQRWLTELWLEKDKDIQVLSATQNPDA